MKKKRKAPVSASIFLLFLMLPFSSYAEYPPQYLFDRIEKEVKDELKEVPPCFPNCAEVESGILTLNESAVSIELKVVASEEVAFPILSTSSNWNPSQIQVNGRNESVVYNGNHLVLLKSGINIVRLTGPVQRRSVSLTFPMKMHNLTAKAPNWSVDGIDKGSLPGNTVRFTRETVQLEKSSTIGEQPLAPTFVIVNRELYFGYEQSVTTTVTRKAPQNVPLTIRIPLLDEEAILTEDMEVDSTHVTVNIPANSNSVSFMSRLPMKHQLTLVAPDSETQVEQWSISGDPRFQISTNGVLPVKQSPGLPPRFWKPRRGDTLRIKVTKPDAVKGLTTTIESARLSIKGGKKSSNATLTLSVNSSKGEPMWILLPDSATPEKLTVRGAVQTLTHREDTLTIPLNPGKQTVELSWDNPVGVSIKTVTDKLILSEPASNITVNYSIPRSRWVLALGGPLMGPAVIIWSILITLIILAVLLPRFIASALSTTDWILLFLGIASVHYLGVLPIVLWMIVMSLRRKMKEEEQQSYKFNLLQMIIAGIATIAVITLISMIPVGLLNSPSMHITGNGSGSYYFNWYQDRCGQELPQGWIISLPIWFYRAIRLFWSVWIAIQLPKWIKWCWQSFSMGRVWYFAEKKKKVTSENQQAG